MTLKKDKSIFVKNVISRRSKLGWSAMKLAEIAGVPYPTWRDIESGKNEGRIKTKQLIAEALNTTIDKLNREDQNSPLVEEMAEYLSKQNAIISKQQKEIENLKTQMSNITHGLNKDMMESIALIKHFPQDILEALKNSDDDDFELLRSIYGLKKKKSAKDRHGM